MRHRVSTMTMTMAEAETKAKAENRKRKFMGNSEISAVSSIELLSDFLFAVRYFLFTKRVLHFKSELAQ
jgi:hypothetical protein